jgi:hypothetical protein
MIGLVHEGDMSKGAFSALILLITSAMACDDGNLILNLLDQFNNGLIGPGHCKE